MPSGLRFDYVEDLVANIAKRTKTFVENHPVATAVAVGLVGGITYKTYIYYRNRRTCNPLSTILTDPLTALNDLYRVNDDFQSDAKFYKIEDCSQPHEQALDLLNQLVAVYEKEESPIFLLGECTKQDFWPCQLSRTWQPRYRNQFEARVVSSLQEKLNSSDAVHYVGFGCGGMFQDLVIACKLLSQKSDGVLTMHLIDPKFWGFLNLYNKSKDNDLNQPFEVDVQRRADFSEGIDKLVDYVQNMDALMRTLSLDEVKRKICLEPAGIEDPAKQFLSFLKTSFPQAVLNLYLYAKATDYTDYVQKNGLPYPDMVCAADIDDEMSLWRNSLNDYNLLCIKVLQNRPDSSNILLRKGVNNACLQLISLDPVDGWEKERITIGHTSSGAKKKIEVYFTQEGI